MVYKLHTNEGTRYVESNNEKIKQAMYQYIRTKRAAGATLASVIYCWTPIHIGRV